MVFFTLYTEFYPVKNYWKICWLRVERKVKREKWEEVKGEMRKGEGVGSSKLEGERGECRF